MKASLNHIFRTIWSDALNTWVAVSELTSAKGKRSGSCVLSAAALADNESSSGNFAKRNRRLRCKPIAIALACCFSLNAQANPIGAQVVNGTVNINQQGNLLTVTNTPNAIVNWQGFSINTGETTNFIQQSASSSILNRVIGSDPSALLGTLTSNGRVFLINPVGIMVGQGAKINVGGLVTTTLNLSDTDFIAGKLNFGPNLNAGPVQNYGNITTPEGGTVYLVAPQVENHGIINTPKGETILAAGNTVQLIDPSTPGVSAQVTGSNNTATNLGQILAESGSIGIVGAVAKNSGTLNASSIVSQGGRILLKASQDAYVQGQGNIQATGTTGGSIQVLGNRVAITDNATLDASGTNGGGTVLVGGDFHGANPSIQNATQTYVGPNTLIKADAIQNGNGGNVAVWSNDATRAYGSISATGGAQEGNGGFIETSGHYLDVAGIRINAGAPFGKFGTWLLDPTDLVISNTATGVQDGSLSSGGGTFLVGAGPATSTIGAGTLEALGAGTNIDLQATNSITINPLTAAGMGTGVNGELTLAQSGSVSFRAGAGGFNAGGNTINVTGGGTLTIDTVGTTVGGLSANGIGTGNGSITAGNLTTAGGTITLNAGTSINVGAIDTGTGTAVSLTAGTNITLNGLVNAGASTIGLLVGQDNVSGILDLTAAGTLTGSAITAAGGTGNNTIKGNGLTYNTFNATIQGTFTADGIVLTSFQNINDTGAATVDMNGVTTGGLSGSITAASATFSNIINAGSVAVTGAATLGGNVTTTGAGGQTYGSTTLAATDVLDAGAANPISLGVVTGAGFDLTTTGLTTIDSTASDLGALIVNQTLTTNGNIGAASVAVTGAATLGGNVTTTGAQTYNDAVTAGTVTLASISGAITANNAGNNFSGTVTASGTSITLNNGTNPLTTGNVTATGSGTVNLTGTGVTNTATISGAGGVTINAGTGRLDNSSGTITNGGITSTGPINLTADTMFLGNGTITGGAGWVTLSPYTSTQLISIGTGSGLILSGSDLATITTTGNLQISNNTGGITVNTALTVPQTAPQIILSTSGTIAVGAPISSVAGSVNLIAPTVTINDNINAETIFLYADTLSVLSGKTVVGWNATNKYGYMTFSPYPSANPLTIGTSSGTDLVNVTQLSAVGGAGAFQSPNMSFLSGGTLTVNSAPTFLNSISLIASTLVINDNIQAGTVNLSADNPISVAGGKTVVGWNATNNYGNISFSPYTYVNPLVVGSGGLVDITKLSAYGGSGTFQSPEFDFSSGSTLTVNSALNLLGTISLRAPTLVAINDNIQAGTVNLSADNPISVAGGKTVVGWNATNNYGNISFSPYTYVNPLVVGSGGLVDITKLSAYGGSGTFKSPEFDFSSGSTLTVNSALNLLGTISLRAPTLAINDNIQAGQVNLSADTITIPSNTVVGTGNISFSPYTYANPLTIAASSGLDQIDATQLSAVGSGGTFQSPSMSFSTAGTLTVTNAPPTSLNNLSLSAPTLVINDNIQAGQVNLSADTITIPSNTVVGTGNISFSPYTYANPLTIAASSGLDQIDATQLSAVGSGGTFQSPSMSFSTAGTLTVNSALNLPGVISLSAGLIGETGGSITAPTLYTYSTSGTTLNGVNAVGSFNATNTTSGNIALTNTAAPLTIIGISNTGGDITVSNTGSITVNNPISANGTGNVIVLNAGAGNFINNAGASALTVTGGGNWLVYSTSPLLDTLDGLAYNFKQYNASYGDTILGVDNGFIYTLAPVITANLTGTVSKGYDGTTSATLATGNYLLAGAVDNDIVVLNNPVSGSYDTQHAGTGKTVSISGLTINGASNGAATVYGYQLGASTASSAIGTITPATLTASLSNTGVTKAYDGTTSAPAGFTPTYNITGFATGDTAASLTDTGAAYNFAHVATATTLTVSGLAVGGITGTNSSVAGDYTLNGVNSLNVGATITPATLTASLSNTGVTKTYNGTTSAPAGFTPTYTIGGLVTGDTAVSLTDTGAAYNFAHVATATTLTVSGLAVGGITGTNSSVAGDYTLNGVNSLNVGATITPLGLTVSAETITGTLTKTYDGTVATTGASLSGGAVSGGLSGETITLTGQSLAYNSAHVLAANMISTTGTAVLNVSGGTANSVASDYSITQPSASVTSGVSISPLALTVAAESIGGTLTKTYDGTTAATGASLSGGAVTGGLSGETITLTGQSLIYNSAHVLAANTISETGTTGLNISGGTVGSLASDYSFTAPAITPVAGSITPAILTASLSNTGVAKTYDGTTSAPAGFTPTYTIGGLVTGDTAAALTDTGAAYNFSHVATATTLTVSGLAIGGITGGNSSVIGDYTLNGVSSLNVGASITPASLTSTASIGGTLTKTYDGTTTATGATLSGAVSGAIAGDSLTLNTTGIALNYNSAHVASATTISATGSAGFTIGSSTAGSQTTDYRFTGPTISAATGATITPAILTASLSNTAVTKAYDGTTSAPAGFTPTFTIGGLVTGDTAAALTDTGVAYNSAQIATATTLTVSGLAIGGITGGISSLSSDYTLNGITSLNVAATIAPVNLTASVPPSVQQQITTVTSTLQQLTSTPATSGTSSSKSSALIAPVIGDTGTASTGGSSTPSMLDSSGATIGGTVGTFGGTDIGTTTITAGNSQSGSGQSDSGNGNASSGGKGNGNSSDKGKGGTANGKNDSKSTKNAKPEKC